MNRSCRPPDDELGREHPGRRLARAGQDLRHDGLDRPGAGVLGAQRQDVIGNQRVYTGGDILIAADGQAITNLDQLASLLEKNYRVGDSVTLTIIREGQTKEVTVELVEEPANG